MKKYLVALIGAQLIVVTFLGFKIYEKQKVLGTISTNPLSESSIIRSPSDRVKYFIEPKPYAPRIDISSELAAEDHNRINSDSLNEEREYNVDKSPNTIRIVTLGDSFTYGAYVPTKDNWTEVVERKLNEKPICPNSTFEVINLGMSSYDLQYSLERFIVRGQKYSPDVVLWFVIQNDFEIINELLFEHAEKVTQQVENNGGLRKNINEIDPYELWLKGMKEVENEYGEQNILEKQRKYLSDFKKIHDKPLFVFSFPHLAKEYYTLLDEIFSDKRNYYFHEVPTIYENSSLMIQNDGHPSILGHKLIGEDIYQYLDKKQDSICH